MIANLLILIVISATTVFAQFGFGVQPDVKFDATNDRFDITSMIKDTNKIFSQQLIEQRAKGDSDEQSDGKDDNNDKDDKENDDYRRRFKSYEDQDGVIQDLRSDRSRKSFRRSENDFAYHDRMDSSEGGTQVEYEQNLKHFMNTDNLKSINSGRRWLNYVKHLHGDQEKQPSRRTGSYNNEKDMLLHYAMPFVMNIDGYMKVPLH